MASQRPLIIPWLISKINSQEYPGVRWANNEKTQFIVPWKHGLRQDLTKEDIKLFEDWAIDSGCYDPKRHKPDPARWKRNFRSAINQKDCICLVANNSNSDNPHKVFEITRRDIAFESSEQCPVTGDRTASQHLGSFQAGDTFMYQQMLMSQQMEHLQLHGDNAELYCDLEDFQNTYEIPDVIPPVQENDCSILSSQVPTEDAAAYEGAYAIGSDVPPGIINEVQTGQVPLVQEQDTFQQQLLRHFTYNTFVTDFDVNIYYRGTKVERTTVTNRFGFCLTSRKKPPLPNNYLEDVILPDAREKVSDQILIRAVNCILTNLEQGTLVEVRNGAICAKRLGSCRSFWAITNTPSTALPNPIDKNDYSVLYTLQQFVTELIEFVERRRKDSPQYSIWICLGETWPDNKSWKTKCIMVEIIPVVMRLLHELSYNTGASSLSNSDLNLEISDSLNSQGAILSFLRSIEEKMDWNPN